MSIVEELGSAVGTVAGVVGPSVVRIGRGGGRGAGVVIAADRVLTNSHNLRGPETTVTFVDGRTATATVAGVDPDGDLAVLAVETADAPAVTWGDAPVETGTPVFAVGSLPGGGARVTFGLVSAVGRAFEGPRGRRIAGSIEHTAPLARGSSGGPIAARDGTLVGLNTHRTGDGFYLALPADAALRARVDALAAGRSTSRVRLGVALVPGPAARKVRTAAGLDPRDGLLVHAVEPDSPAGRAGLRQGDLLTGAGTTTLTTPDDLYDALDGVEGDGRLVLRVVRGADDVDVTVDFTPPTPT